MKKIFFSLFLGTVVVSCTNVEDSLVSESRDIDYVEFEAVTYTKEADSRMFVNDQYKYIWESDDVIAIYAGSDNQGNSGTGLTNYHIVSGGTTNATFKYNGFKLIEGNKYFAVYPYRPDQLDRNNLTFSYLGQKCCVNSAFSNLRDCAYMYTEPVVAKADEIQLTKFTGKAVGAIGEFYITAPADAVFSKIQIEGLLSELKLSLKDNGLDIVPSQNAATTTEYLIYREAGHPGYYCEEGTVFTVRYMLAQQKPQQNLKFTLIATDGRKWQATIKGLEKDINPAKVSGWYVPSEQFGGNWTLVTE